MPHRETVKEMIETADVVTVWQMRKWQWALLQCTMFMAVAFGLLNFVFNALVDSGGC